MKLKNAFSTKKIAAGICITAMLAGAAPVQVFADMDPVEIELGSGAERGPGFVSANEFFEAGKGTYDLILCGLKEENRAAVLKALSEYYDPDVENPIRFVDSAFPDAEKYDNSAGTYDSEHCWAGSVSNMLWMTGWAEGFSDPHTGADFSSEDDVFQYFNVKFSNYGNDHVASAVDWFFMGEFYNPPYVNHSARLIPEAMSAEDGVLKSFVSSFMQEHFDLIRYPQQIGQLLFCDWSLEEGGVFEAGIGKLDAGEPIQSEHSVTAAGVITDPNAKSPEEQFKAIILIDSDNSASPEYDGETVEDPALEYKEEKKRNRPNTMTVYNLRYRTSPEGVHYWLIDGYATKREGYPLDEWAIYYLNKLPVRDEALITEGTEPEGAGTMSVIDTVDLTLEAPFTTDRETPVRDMYHFNIDELTVREFVSGEPVRLNYFIANRSEILFDESRRQGNDLIVDWSVIRDADQAVVASGKQVCDEEIMYNAEKGFLVELNKRGDSYAAWKPGEYTVQVELNTDQTVVEAYYLNNVPGEAHFTVTERQAADLSNAEVTLSKTSYTYNGKSKKPAVTVKVEGRTLEKGLDYTVVYAPGRTSVGTYDVTVSGIGSISGTQTVSFKINPKGTNMTSLKAARNSLTASWATQAEKMGSSVITGYQVQYSRSKTFAKGNEKVTVRGYQKTSKKIGDLTSGKKYYVRVRTYKTVDGKKYYSSWSEAKSTAVK